MVKEKIGRRKAPGEGGKKGQIEQGKTELTGGIYKVLSDTSGGEATAFEDIDKAPEERERGITIQIAHVEY